MGYTQKSYKTVCPKCQSDNFYITPRNNMGYCFSPSCHYVEHDGKAPKQKQKIRSEHIQEIRALYTHLAQYYHSSLTAEALQFLYSRGFNDITIQQLKIGYCPKGTLPVYKKAIAKDAGLATAKHEAFLAHRITFPYFKDTRTVTDIRARTLDKDDNLKYKSPYGDAFYRGAIFPYNYHLAHKQPRIILTEGEIKADIAVQTGYPTIAVPGIGAWRSGFIQEDDQEIIIVFDNEYKPHIQHEVMVAIEKIVQHLDNVRIAVLPLYGSEKAEIDTFINKHGAGLFQRIIDNALTYTEWKQVQSPF